MVIGTSSRRSTAIPNVISNTSIKQVRLLTNNSNMFTHPCLVRTIVVIVLRLLTFQSRMCRSRRAMLREMDLRMGVERSREELLNWEFEKEMEPEREGMMIL